MDAELLVSDFQITLDAHNATLCDLGALLFEWSLDLRHRQLLPWQGIHQLVGRGLLDR